MKRVPFKINNNKAKLQINRGSPDHLGLMVVKNRTLKENSNIFLKLQQKEENTTNAHRFPSISNIATVKRPSVRSQFEELPVSNKKMPLPRSQSKQRLHRTSSTNDFKKCEQQSGISMTILKQAVVDFIKLIQGKNIVRPLSSNFIISSQNLRIILLYIITSKSQFHKNQAVLLAAMSNEGILDNFFSQNSECQSFGVHKRRFLEVCSKTIQQMVSGKGLNGELVKELARVAGVLMKEVAELEGRKQLLEDQIKQGLHSVRQNQRKNLTLQLQVEGTKTELQGLVQALEGNKTLLLQTQSKKKEIQNFINVQSNLIAKQASEYHKNLQIDLFEYSDFLKHHPLGRKQFEPSIFYVQIQRLQGVEVKQVVSSLLHDRNQEKEACLRDFLKRLRHQYKLMIDQLTRTITEKTKYIQKFTEFMNRWYENYLAKKEYLSGLAEAFSLESVTLQHLRQGIEVYCDQQSEKMPIPSPACVTTLKKIFAGIQKLVEIFGLGNSFY